MTPRSVRRGFKPADLPARVAGSFRV